jgi:predicted transcriptional regulator
MTTFAIITTREIGALCKLKPSASAVLVYTTLLTYAQDKVSCFPKVETIRARMQNAYSRSAIMKALKWLDDYGFIQRNDRRSKERFKLLKRVVKQATEKLVESVSNLTQSTSPIVHCKKNKEKNPFFKGGYKKDFSFRKKKNTMGYGRFHSSQKEGNNELVCEAEKVFGAFVISTHYPDISGLSVSDKAVITQSLRSNAKVDIEWRKWVEEVHPGCLPQFLLSQGGL